MPKVKIDGREIEVPQGTTVLQAAEMLGFEVPQMCYHPGLSIVGVCRVCLCQVEGMPKLTTSCSTEVRDGMEVGLYVPEAEKARRGVIEFWLLNHPLDCPICDQGGECPLQDIAFDHGPGESRLDYDKIKFDKRKVLGPQVILDEERCILCWRCTRFTQEVSESHQLMLDERGAHTTISTPPGAEFDDPFSANVVDLCPVGALTTRDFRFKSRIWEMGSSAAIATNSSVGENIFIWSKKGTVERLTSRPNLKVNDYWLADQSRFDFKFINDPMRLTEPLVRVGESLMETTWQEGMKALAEGLGPAMGRGSNRLGALTRRHLSNEEYWGIQKMVRGLGGSNNISAGRDEQMTEARVAMLQRGRILDSVVKIEGADLIIALGADIEKTHGVYGLRIRKAIRERGTRFVQVCDSDSRLSEVAMARDNAGPSGAAGWIAKLGGALNRGDKDGIAGIVRGAKRIVFMINAGAHNTEVAAAWDSFESTVTIEGTMKPMFLDDGGNIMGAALLGIGPDYYPGFKRISSEESQAWKGRWGGKVHGEPGLGWNDTIAAAGKGDVQAMMLFNSGRPGNWNFSSQEIEALKKAPFVAAFDMFAEEVQEFADIIIPTPSFAEIDGTYVNQDGLVQLAQFNILPKASPLTHVLHTLTGQLGGKPRGRAAIDIFREITRDVPQFADMDYGKLQDQQGIRVNYSDALVGA